MNFMTTKREDARKPQPINNKTSAEKIKKKYATPGALQTAIILKALQDEEFKKSLIDNPVETLKKNFSLSQVDFKDVKINVVEESDKEFYIVIPSKNTMHDLNVHPNWWWKLKEIHLRNYPDLMKNEIINKIIK
jgi:hypothetical protein